MGLTPRPAPLLYKVQEHEGYIAVYWRWTSEIAPGKNVAEYLYWAKSMGATYNVIKAAPNSLGAWLQLLPQKGCTFNAGTLLWRDEIIWITGEHDVSYLLAHGLNGQPQKSWDRLVAAERDYPIMFVTARHGSFTITLKRWLELAATPREPTTSLVSLHAPSLHMIRSQL